MPEDKYYEQSDSDAYNVGIFWIIFTIIAFAFLVGGFNVALDTILEYKLQLLLIEAGETMTEFPVESKCMEVHKEGLLVGVGEFFTSPSTSVAVDMRSDGKNVEPRKEYKTIKDMLDEIGWDHKIVIRDWDKPTSNVRSNSTEEAK